MSTLKLPLKGIRIADFTIHAAGPFGTHVLSQLGARNASKSRAKRARMPSVSRTRYTDG